MSQFRKLMLVVLSSGALAGLALFAVQHFTVIPLIKTAETYEAAAHRANPEMTHEDEGWQPTSGWERTSFTALTTMFTGIGFAAMLFGSLSLTGTNVNARRALGPGGFCLLRSGSCSRITPATPWCRCCGRV